MTNAKCIQKFRNKNNVIIGYRLMLHDGKNSVMDIEAQKLKNAIKSKKIHVVNLTLTSDNRLVDTKDEIIETEKNKKETPNKYALLTREIVKKIDRPKELKFRDRYSARDVICAAKERGIPVKKISEEFSLIELANEVILISPYIIRLNNSVHNENVLRKEDETVGLFQETKFTVIHFQGVDTSNVTNMKKMFYLCEARALYFSTFDTSNVKDMSMMFYKNMLDSLDLRGFNTINVENMEYMFADGWLKELNISSFNTSNVKNMHGMFSNVRIQGLDVSHFDTSQVRDMSTMFYRCNVENTNFSNFNTANVEDMSMMFNKSWFGYHAKLKFSSFDTSNVRKMAGMFGECEADVLDLSNFNTSNVEIMTSMFYKCSIKNLILGRFNVKRVKDMSNMFKECRTGDLDLSSFFISDTVRVESMFECTEARILNIGEMEICQLDSDKRSRVFYNNDIDFIIFSFADAEDGGEEFMEEEQMIELCKKYNKCEVDAFRYVKEFCCREHAKTASRLIEIYEKTNIAKADGEKPSEKVEEYYNICKQCLMEHFGLELVYDEAQYNGVCYN